MKIWKDDSYVQNILSKQSVESAATLKSLTRSPWLAQIGHYAMEVKKADCSRKFGGQKRSTRMFAL